MTWRHLRIAQLASVATVLPTAAAIGCASSLRPPAQWFERRSNAATATVDAAGLHSLVVRSGVANVRVVGDSVPHVRVEIVLRSSDRERLTGTCVPTARLDTVRASGVLTLAVVQPERDRCGETWTVSAPAHLFVSLDLAHGDVDARGLAGGLRVSNGGTGTVRASLVRGDVDVRVGVGDIELSTEQREYGALELSSDVGDVHLEVGGYRVPAGDRRGAGRQIRMTGRGTGRVSAHTRVGDVRVTVGASP